MVQHPESSKQSLHWAWFRHMWPTGALLVGSICGLQASPIFPPVTAGSSGLPASLCLFSSGQRSLKSCSDVIYKHSFWVVILADCGAVISSNSRDSAMNNIWFNMVSPKWSFLKFWKQAGSTSTLWKILDLWITGPEPRLRPLPVLGWTMKEQCASIANVRVNMGEIQA